MFHRVSTRLLPRRMVLTTILLETIARCLMRIRLGGCLLAKQCIGSTQQAAILFRLPDAEPYGSGTVLAECLSPNIHCDGVSLAFKRIDAMQHPC